MISGGATRLRPLIRDCPVFFPFRVPSADEIVPIRTKIVDPKTEESRDIVVDADDGIRPGTTAESLGALKPAFKKLGNSPLPSCVQIFSCGLSW